MSQKTKGVPCEIYSRVVGYMRPVQQWNPGKKAEFSDRKEYDVNEKFNKVLEKV